ncbi:MAG: MazG-like family protein, partial [Syntrophobacter sp.]
MENLKDLSVTAHYIAKEHGWWDVPKSVPELLCLVHSEVSEALEAYRIQDKENFAEELADIIIRVLDMSEGLGVDIQAAVIAKMGKNKNRPYKHGGKLI